MRLRLLLPAAAIVAAIPSAALGAHADQSAYVNPDTGKATENPDVDPTSSCADPVQQDTQDAGSLADGTNNVHIDGCIFDADGNALDTTVSWELSGAGGIFACPDPDADGPKTATATDTNGDGRNDLCTLTGYEADNLEYHVRIASDTSGLTTVLFCTDPETNGCADAGMTDTIVVNWTGGNVGATSNDLDTLPNTGGGLAVAAIAALGGAGLLRRRTA